MVFCSIMLQETSAQESFSFQLQLCFLEKVRRFLANLENCRVSSGCELQGNIFLLSVDSEKTRATGHQSNEPQSNKIRDKIIEELLISFESFRPKHSRFGEVVPQQKTTR